MIILLQVILPVFLVIGAGYLAAKRGVVTEAGIDGVMQYAQGVAIPVLLFIGLARLDLSAVFELRLYVSFYTSCTLAFLAGMLGARVLFGRDWEDAVAIGFVALFSNSLLLGLPITERAFGTEATASNYAIIAIHSPFCYLLGITAMEIARAKGHAPRDIPAKVAKAVLTNPLVAGALLGLVANLVGLPLPQVAWDGLALLASGGLPAALFGLGGVLARYRPEGDMATILFVVSLSLIAHPAMAWALGRMVDLPEETFRSVVVTAAMAPGANAYIFSSMYQRAQRVAASAVLVGTALSIVTAAGWLWALS